MTYYQMMNVSRKKIKNTKKAVLRGKKEIKKFQELNEN